ncbi:protein phosphatase 1L-like [Apostichopus japonicus]|uniref:protein phosphatase 1L-like n=1 Tax=Stichopus japonicus TaxID=307972 RepID=UPI003AB87C42
MTLLAAMLRYIRNTLLRPEVLVIFVLCILLILYTSVRSDNWFLDKLTGLVFFVKDTPEGNSRRRYSGLNGGPGPPKLRFDPNEIYKDINSVVEEPVHDEVKGYSYEEDNMAVYAIQGRRPGMEDRFQYKKSENGEIQVYGVFDGHGGPAASSFTREHLLDAILDRIADEDDLSEADFPAILREEILSLDEQYIAVAKQTADFSGSTCVVGLIYKSKLYVANVGDSRAVMLKTSGQTIPLSADHKPDHEKERKRIEEAGGHIAFFGVWRVVGILATSRAIGDLPLKVRNFINAEADVVTLDTEEQEADFMIIATDGLWDVFTNEDATQLIRANMGSPFLGSKHAVIQAYLKGSMDNITVMVIKLYRTDKNS